MKIQGNATPFPCFSARPEEESLQCRSKWHCFRLFFSFYEQWMKQRRFGKNAPFHLNENDIKCVKVQISL
jgi:hypothetical protein